MDTNEIKRLLDESCAELSRILDDCRHGSPENVRVVDVMEPILQEFRELQEQVFACVARPNSKERRITMNHMNNKIDFTVRCKHWPFRETTFQVYYIKHEGKWLPLPPNQCDNADGSEACDKCIGSVIEEALAMTPPFARWPFPEDSHTP